jgi:HSP20 family protein
MSITIFSNDEGCAGRVPAPFQRSGHREQFQGGGNMNLVRWNPLHEMASIRDRFNRLFDESLYPAGRSEEALGLSAWNPSVDIYENDDNIVIKAEIPGVDKDDITVDLKGRVLTLKGERKSDNEVKEDRFYRREMSYGRFERAFTLPADVEAETVKADFKDGVLKVEVPKPEEQKPRQITIQ